MDVQIWVSCSRRMKGHDVPKVSRGSVIGLCRQARPEPDHWDQVEAYDEKARDET